jgi:hypothetical protein
MDQQDADKVRQRMKTITLFGLSGLFRLSGFLVEQN